MHFPKSVGLLLIVGLLISSCSFGENTVATITLEDTKESPSQSQYPTNRNSLTGLSGGEQNIDPFTVNPINRWDSSSSGPLTTGIENGELSLETYLNDSSESYYFRESSTADDTISVRWRLNQTADGVYDNIDAFIAGRNDGLDGLDFEEGDVEDATKQSGSGVLSYLAPDGFPSLRLAEGFTHTHTNFTFNLDFSFNADIYDLLVIRWKVDLTAGNNITIKEINGGYSGEVVFSYTEYSIADDNTWQIDTIDLSSEDAWTGSLSEFTITVYHTDGTNPTTMDGEIVYFDYFKLIGDNTELQGDFSIPLCGLNATTSEGTGNTTLTAFQHNSTHYTIRPTFTTEDGANSRSWNLDSDYQDFYSLIGIFGADGLDWTEGDDHWAGLSDAQYNNGYLLGKCIAGPTKSFFPSPDYRPDINTNYYNYATIKLKSNESSLTMFMYGTKEGIHYDLTSTVNISTEWTVFTFNFSADSDWTGIFQRVNCRFSETDGTLEGDEWIWIDYIRLTTENVSYSDDRHFFEFNEYYRAELDYDLRSSQLEFELQDDLGDDVSKEEIGDASINAYFDTRDLIPDIFIAEVGQIDYLLGIRTAGSNGTAWWDYYQAEFAEFNWKFNYETYTNDDWETASAYNVYNELDTNDGRAEIRYRLTVPEFDACTGKLVIDEMNDSVHVVSTIVFLAYSVDTSDGSLTEILRLAMADFAGDTYPIAYFRTAGSTWQEQEASNNIAGWGAVTFSFYFDKQSRDFTAQSECKDKSSNPRRLVGAETLASTESNEIVFEIKYITQGDAACTNAIVSLLLEDWSLTFRDIFGLPLDLPGVDDVIGGVASFLGDILRALLFPIAIGLDEIAKLLAPLTDILAQLGVLDLIEGAIDSIGTAITSAISGMEGVLDAAISAVEDAVDDVATAIAALAAQIGQAIVDFTEEIITEALNFISLITDEAMAFIRSVEVAGVTLGEILDLTDEMIFYLTSTLGTTIGFATMLLTTWGAIFMAGLFGFGWIYAALVCSHPGEFFEKLWGYYAVKLFSIPIIDFPIHLGTIVIPYAIFIIFVI